MKGSTSRGEVASRVTAAVGGGYAVSAGAAVSLSLLLPMPRAEAVLTGTMASFVIYLLAALWAFSAASAVRAWAAGLGGLFLLLRLGAGA